MPGVAQVTLAAVVLFALTGFGVTRFALPDGLRRHELLWVLPVGAAATAFAMTPLGFLGVAYGVNLAIVLAAGTALSVVAWRRRGLPPRPSLPDLGWPVYLALLLMAIALVPLFRSGFLTVIGDGSDAHLAAGTAEFLKHAPPRGVAPELPVDQVPLVWRSKQSIYYAFAAVSTLSGRETYEVLSTLGALLLTFAALGWFVFARDVLGARARWAALAMALAGLDRMVIHTGIHPYFNQTWGYMTLPFTLVLVAWVLRHPSAGGAGLLGLFLVLCAFAYPLAVPIPVLVLLVAWWLDRRRRRKAGEAVAGRRELWARFKRLPRWARVTTYLVGFLLLAPAFGVWEKLVGGTQLLINPNYSLELWGGDLDDWYPEQQFFAIHMQDGWWVALLVIAGFALWELRRLPRAYALGVLAVLVAGAVIAAEMRLRDYGWYYHFKMLAFVGPLVVVLGATGMARARSLAASRWLRGGLTLMLLVWASWGVSEARDEVATTYDELPRTTLELREWSDRLPRGSSIRLDMQPGAQLWTAYLLHEHRLCSQRPLDDTSYPHVPLSRAADYVLVRALRKPFDAVGEPLFQNKEFRLYRLQPDLPGGDRCSQRMIQTVQRIEQG